MGTEQRGKEVNEGRDVERGNRYTSPVTATDMKKILLRVATLKSPARTIKSSSVGGKRSDGWRCKHRCHNPPATT